VQARWGTLVANRLSSDSGSDRPVGAIVALLDALLRDGRTQHVAQQRLAARRVEHARRRGRVQGEPIERGAQRLVVGERVRLERQKAAHPLRSRGRRLVRGRRGGEVALGIAVTASIVAVLVDAEQATAPKGALDAPDDTLEHVAHLAGLQMPLKASSP
jgi:hypothetical protein